MKLTTWIGIALGAAVGVALAMAGHRFAQYADAKVQEAEGVLGY